MKCKPMPESFVYTTLMPRDLNGPARLLLGKAVDFPSMMESDSSVGVLILLLVMLSLLIIILLRLLRHLRRH